KKKKEPTKPVSPQVNTPAVPLQNIQTAKKDSTKAMPDSIKAMMQKARIKDTLKEKEKKTADSIKAARQKEI
ncbi:MAG: hypothetical protein C0412_03065, partial [Flavobacterium sp.]|nr:hypothetical protein [Flavobacterium sp.]